MYGVWNRLSRSLEVAFEMRWSGNQAENIHRLREVPWFRTSEVHPGRESKDDLTSRCVPRLDQPMELALIKGAFPVATLF